jgi:hypothetical protein
MTSGDFKRNSGWRRVGAALLVAVNALGDRPSALCLMLCCARVMARSGMLPLRCLNDCVPINGVAILHSAER